MTACNEAETKRKASKEYQQLQMDAASRGLEGGVGRSRGYSLLGRNVRGRVLEDMCKEWHDFRVLSWHIYARATAPEGAREVG